MSKEKKVFEINMITGQFLAIEFIFLDLMEELQLCLGIKIYVLIYHYITILYLDFINLNYIRYFKIQLLVLF